MDSTLYCCNTQHTLLVDNAEQQGNTQRLMPENIQEYLIHKGICNTTTSNTVSVELQNDRSKNCYSNFWEQKLPVASCQGSLLPNSVSWVYDETEPLPQLQKRRYKSLALSPYFCFWARTQGMGIQGHSQAMHLGVPLHGECSSTRPQTQLI